MSNTDPIQAFVAAEQRYLNACEVDAQSHTLQLTALGLEARVLQIGTGPPVVLLHGGGAMGSSWAPLMKHLTGYQLWAPDRPGFGLTSLTPYRGVDLRQHAIQFVQGVLDAAGLDRVALVANSMGGLWSLWFAQAYPERVACLALLGTPALILDTSAPGPMRLMSIPWFNRLLLALDRPGLQQVRRLWTRLGHDPAQNFPPELEELMVRLQELPNFRAAWRSLLENVLRVHGAAPGMHFDEQMLQDLPHAVLYIWGRQDPFGSVEVGQRVRAATPKGELQVIGEGHLPWVDEPQACAQAVQEFLGREFRSEAQ